MNITSTACFTCRERLNSLVEKGIVSKEETIFLHSAARTHRFALPLRRDNGEVEIVDAFRVQYNNALGPTKGGIRYHPEVNLEEVSTLAFLMTLKTSLLHLPFGGAKGGIRVDARNLSRSEKERLTREYVRALRDVIGPRKDIPAPDMNTDAQTMAWFVDEYSRLVGSFCPAVVTGKPIELGGSLGREEATALGGAYVLREAAQDYLGKNVNEITVAIQGFGNVGGHIARILHTWGARIVSVSTSRSCHKKESGLDPEEMWREKQNKTLANSSDGGDPESVLFEDVDVLIPAALGNVITKQNAERVRARLIVEMANDPVGQEAEDILKEKGIRIIPDILANAGGVLVSYFEWIQGTSNEYWEIEEVNTKLEKKMVSVYRKVFKLSQEKGLSPRDASYLVALRRIIDAEKMRGRYF